MYGRYAAAKRAVGQLTRALANKRVSKGVNVNVVAPGYMETANTAPWRARMYAQVGNRKWESPKAILQNDYF